PPAPDAVRRLLAGDRDARLRAALEGLRVLDPACGAGALLAAAHRLARAQGARLALSGVDLAPVAADAARARLAAEGARAEIACADALARRWAPADLVLANPPFLRHEAIPAREKARAAKASGLSRQADLSAHFAAVALRAAPVVALVWPRALDVSRSAEPLRADAAARGGFVLRLRSRAAGSFAASVDTVLAVWSLGATQQPEAEAAVALADLSDAALAGLARGVAAPGLAFRRKAAAPSGAVPLGELCAVRFGTKTGCNAFFHLRPEGDGRFRSELAGLVRLAPDDVVPVLATLKEAAAPERLAPAHVLFRPGDAPGEAALRYVRRGERLGVHRRPTCAGRSPWWRLAPGRGPAPVLYPAKVGARAFGILNAAGIWEDKKFHALFPRGVDPAHLALLLGATPIRLAIDEGARQLTGAQAIADVDCRVLAAAPFPRAAAIAAASADLDALRSALARDPVTTDLDAMLDRPAQRDLDRLAGALLGLGARDVERSRAALRARVAARLAHAAQVRAKVQTLRSSRA
ncbi:MAG TPA: methyltransferase domain-containing protein, partial [Anaeromyxobacteraceae bacterium]|nr:methyltransferase domain-containing protein [Anaeromyxobacteraceae bacterium]